MTVILSVLLSVTVPVPPLVSNDVLEPSVRNEVDHALACVPEEAWRLVWTNAPVMAAQRANLAVLVPTNGLARTDLAIRLVSRQRETGRWHSGTNDVTAAAVEILREL